MKKFMDCLNDGPVKDWYTTHKEPKLMGVMAHMLEKEGYILDPESGLFVKPLFKESIQPIGFTLIDIVFPRPTDYHAHPKMGEAFKVVKGSGAILMNSENSFGTPLNIGDQVYIAPGTKHALRPGQEGYVGIHLLCDKVYDSSQEECIKRFDQFKPWIDYFDETV
jgi:mannose-6-phosphate isomerase-like protein (cupin superfamily)